MLGLNQRKLQKLKTNPKLFFKDAIEKKLLHLNSTYNKYLPKKHKGFTQYTIISAVITPPTFLSSKYKSLGHLSQILEPFSCKISFNK